LKNDFLEFLENSQPFRLSLDPSRPRKNAVPGPQQAKEKSEKRLFRIFRKFATF
ncbi:hypothetical protein T11_6750, partial [Trichinella zimbabwensis]